jgi:hypothetical protein
MNSPRVVPAKAGTHNHRPREIRVGGGYGSRLSALRASAGTTGEEF